MSLLTQDTQKVVSRLIAHAWFDKEFKERLISDPVTVLKENGLTIPSNAQVCVNENASLESMINMVANFDKSLIYEIPMPLKLAGFTDKQIQSWADKNNPEDITFCF